ncbi:MAG: cytochrome P450, partial [Actinomycetota bacterium]
LDRWLVTPRSLVLELLRDTETFTTASDASPIRSTFGPQMLSTDGDAQKNHRAPFAPGFRPRVVGREFAAGIAGRCDELVDALAPGGDDLAPFASNLAVMTVADVLGLRVDDPGRIKEWYDDLAAALANVMRDPDIAERARATAEVVRSLVGDAGMVARLAGPLERAAVDSNILLILFGGIETAESMIVNAVWALLSHPEAVERVRRDPGLIPSAVEESLRWEPAVQTLTRYATRDAELGGVTIRRGDIVEGMIGGANRDPEHFADPDRFDVTRANARDLTFGYGKHTCIGIHLARLQAQTTIRTLLDSLPGLRLDAERPSRPRGHEFRKVRPLWVTWDAT